MSFHSGIRFDTGHPKAWQNGMPQSMHRDAWISRAGRGSICSISWKSRTRSATARCGGFSLGNSRKPVSLPTEDLLGRRDGLGLVELLLLHPLEDLPVVDRHHLDEQGQAGVPPFEDH